MIVFEISNKWVKALWGKAILKDIQVSNIVAKSIKSNSPEELFKIVSSILNKKIYKTFRPLVLCVPRNQITLRNLKFPSKNEGELDSIVDLHLTQQVPYSREEIVYNYEILEKTSSGFTKILLGIAHKELLRRQFYPFEKLGIFPENVQLSTFGLLRFLRKAKVVKENNTRLKAHLDIDADFSDLLLFKQNKILFSKSITMGHSQLKQPDRISRFMGELKQALVVFQTEEARESPSMLYISGVTTEETTLPQEIKKGLQLPVERIDPLNVVTSLKSLKETRNILKWMSISMLLGAALEPLSKRFNFVLPEAKLKKDVRDTAKNLIVTGSIVIYLIVLTLFGFMGQVYTRQVYLNRLTDEIVLLESGNRSTVEALNKVKAVKNFTRPKESVLYYYYELVKIVPENITVDRLIYNKKKEFAMIGRGTDMGEIFRFVGALGNAAIFGKVELKYSRKKVQGEREFNEFEVVCHPN